ncbi:MAG: hypothetical protein BGO77_00450 [Caedibacter sp. 37-49]|nr:MAG: hypothetical protein BGO77_00450 [Caedibacter sp. 37-49]
MFRTLNLLFAYSIFFTFNCFASENLSDDQKKNAITTIKQYENKIVRRNSNEIQRDVNAHKTYKGFGRQKGTKYERRTWNQLVLGRNEDNQIQRLQEKGMEVSVNLSTGANLNRLADMVDERDKEISKITDILKSASIIIGSQEREIVTLQNTHEEVKNTKNQTIIAKDQTINTKDMLIQMYKTNEQDYAARLFRMIEKINPKSGTPKDASITQLLTGLEGLVDDLLQEINLQQ